MIHDSKFMFLVFPALKVLVGNKADLASKVPEENVQDFAAIYNCDMVFRVSAKTGKCLDRLVMHFHCITS
jgi:tRNA U34 5-carboxymethylaminomethyl modifying GTPase MnmE/TrmE